MIKSRIFLLTVVCLSSWLAVTFILLLNRPDGASHRNGNSQHQLSDRIKGIDVELRKQASIVKNLSLRFDGLFQQKGTVQIGILVIACDRPTVDRALTSLLKYRSDKHKFPIVVSQDCRDEATKQAIQAFGNEISYIEQPDTSNIPLNPSEVKFSGYYKIARHYKFALGYMFDKLKFKAVIVTEDDLEIAEDFYNYFEATYQLLLEDESLLCVSAWNDNGKINNINKDHSGLLYRSDFFPGLGWMLTANLWDELKVKWPRGFWDDWLRLPENRRERSCIRPEVSRTRTFGKKGVSLGQFFDSHLKYIVLNKESVQFQTMNLNYLSKEKYDLEFLEEVYNSPPVSLQAVLKNKLTTSPVRLTYNNKKSFVDIARALGLMDDFKSGVPRTAYRGIVTTFTQNTRIYVAPPKVWNGYDTSW